MPPDCYIDRFEHCVHGTDIAMYITIVISWYVDRFEFCVRGTNIATCDTLIFDW